MSDVEKDLALVEDSNAPLPERIAAGARLWDLSDRARKALEPLKDALRAEAKARLKENSGAVHIEGAGMTRALVTIPEPSYTLAKDADLSRLRRELGSWTFESLFEETISVRLRAGLETKIPTLDPRAQTEVLRAVSEAPGKPRVSFQYGGSGISEYGSD